VVSSKAIDGNGSFDIEFYVPNTEAIRQAGTYFVVVTDDASRTGQVSVTTTPAPTPTPTPTPVPGATFITKWGTSGTGEGQFDEPIGIAVAPNGNVYVADSENNNIQKFTVWP